MLLLAARSARGLGPQRLHTLMLNLPQETQRPHPQRAVTSHLRLLGWLQTRGTVMLPPPQRNLSMLIELTPDDAGLAFRFLMTGEGLASLPDHLLQLEQEDWIALEHLMRSLLQQKSWSSLH